MARLLSLLLIFVLVGLNGAGLATAICQHEDARAHTLARHSPDVGVAAAALAEEAASAAQEDGALAAAAAVQLAGFLLPSVSDVEFGRLLEPIGYQTPALPVLGSRAITPLLGPPLL